MTGTDMLEWLGSCWVPNAGLDCRTRYKITTIIIGKDSQKKEQIFCRLVLVVGVLSVLLLLIITLIRMGTQLFTSQQPWAEESWLEFYLRLEKENWWASFSELPAHWSTRLIFLISRWGTTRERRQGTLLSEKAGRRWIFTTLSLFAGEIGHTTLEFKLSMH